MADVARIRNLQCVALCRCDEAERVGAHVHVRDRLLNLGHVARDALAAGAAGLVVGVRFDRGRVRTVLCIGSVAVETDVLGRLPQNRVVLRAMHVVAAEASDASRVHQALHEIVALHPVLMRCAVGKVSE